MRIILVIAAALLAACSSTTVIKSSDPEAKIFVNGEYLGTGQATYTDRKVAFSSNTVTISKPGCADQHHEFQRNEDPDFGAIIGGFLVYVPFLWVTEYKEQRGYDYQCAPVEPQTAPDIG
jgi:hypothetical protein